MNLLEISVAMNPASASIALLWLFGATVAWIVARPYLQYRLGCQIGSSALLASFFISINDEWIPYGALVAVSGAAFWLAGLRESMIIRKKGIPQ